MEDRYKTDPETFKLIFELYIYVYILWIEIVIKNFFSNEVKSNFMLDTEKKIHIALKEYSLNYYKSKKSIKSNNIDKSSDLYRSS